MLQVCVTRIEPSSGDIFRSNNDELQTSLWIQLSRDEKLPEGLFQFCPESGLMARGLRHS